MSQMLIDFGCNFGSTKYYPPSKLSSILSNARAAGVEKCVVISNSLSETKHALELIKQYDLLCFTVGIHPHNAKQFKPKDIEYIRYVYESNPQCIAIGEMGLDYNRNFSSVEDQLLTFESQVRLSKELNAAMYCHLRDAFEDFRMILERNEYFKGLVHCFTGSEDEAAYLLTKGFSLGITGVLFDKRRNASVRAVVAMAPIERLVVETDAPFMSYFEKKRRESVPEDVARIVREIANIKAVEEEECRRILYQNARNLLLK